MEIIILFLILLNGVFHVEIALISARKIDISKKGIKVQAALDLLTSQ
jgi:hypothetical protein